MTESPRRSARSRRSLRSALVASLGLAVAFGVGVALGEALHDNPSPGGTQTLVRTLRPLALPPVAQTVRVTVTAPASP